MGKAVRRGAGIHNRNISDAAGIKFNKLDTTFQNEAEFLADKSAKGFYPAVPEVGDMYYDLSLGGLFVADEIIPGDVRFVPIGGTEGDTIFTLDASLTQAQILDMHNTPVVLLQAPEAPDGHMIEFITGRIHHSAGGGPYVGAGAEWAFQVLNDPGAGGAPATALFSQSTVIPDTVLTATGSITTLSTKSAATIITRNSTLEFLGDSMTLQIASTNAIALTLGNVNLWTVRVFYRLFGISNSN